MNFGYLLVVSENSDVDYLKLAYALALSIKNTQKPGYDKVALVIENKNKINDLKSPWVFDEIIEWNKETFWNGRSWMDELSPWENTICLDVDMIFLRDYSHYVDYFIANCDLYMPNRSYTYRNEVVKSDYYRKTFTKNNLPNVYSFYTFFKKGSDTVRDFFELGRYIIKNPDSFSNLFLANFKPNIVGTDEAFALSAKILGIEDLISYNLDFPKIVHLKGMVQNFPWPANTVSDHIGFYFDQNGGLMLGNYKQYDIVHYVEKDKITDEFVSILEDIAWKK